MPDIISPEKVATLVGKLKPTNIKNVGCSEWLTQHGIIVELSQQAAIEAQEKKREVVIHELLAQHKLEVLLNEILVSKLWQDRVLPDILKIDPNATFLIYAAIFHEAIALALLELSLFHADTCQALADVMVDIIDYCCKNIYDLIANENDDTDMQSSSSDISIQLEINRQKKEKSFKISLRSISMLYYLIMNSSDITLSNLRRLVDNFDMPGLMIDMLQRKPWMRHTKDGHCQLFKDEKWQNVESGERVKISKYEGQTWLFLHQVLLNRAIASFYKITDSRREKLNRCLNLFTEPLLDQLPVLLELQRAMLKVRLTNEDLSGDAPPPLLLQVIPHIHASIEHDMVLNGGALAIAEYQVTHFFTPTEEALLAQAKQLSLSYNTDIIADFEDAKQKNETEQDVPVADDAAQQNSTTCYICHSATTKKCSACKLVYYCSKKCQKEHWKLHKMDCKMVS